ncbi:hypothetical protein BC829DRAFT_478000 [Chytridium lagenaria]|nr:hypothetical protein BC829DRAFT_478000 [Chytridium lagenaria]
MYDVLPGLFSRLATESEDSAVGRASEPPAALKMEMDQEAPKRALRLQKGGPAQAGVVEEEEAVGMDVDVVPGAEVVNLNDVAPMMYVGYGNFSWRKPHGSVETKRLTREMAIQGSTAMFMSEREQQQMTQLRTINTLVSLTPWRILTLTLRHITQMKKRLRRCHERKADCTASMILESLSTFRLLTKLFTFGIQFNYDKTPGCGAGIPSQTECCRPILRQPGEQPDAGYIVDRDIQGGDNFHHLGAHYAYTGERRAWNVVGLNEAEEMEAGD